MLELTFYKGVPFDSENENVLFCSKTERDLFLQDYEINVVPITLEDKWYLNGTDEQCFLTVSLLQEPFNANYLKMIQSLVEPNTLTETKRVLFFFINSYRQGAENSVELNLTLDKWNSYFMREENEIISIPELKNGVAIQGHFYSQTSGLTEIIEKGNIVSDFTNENLLFGGGLETYKLLVHMTTVSPIINETVLISDANLFYTDALEILNNMSRVETFNATHGATTESNIKFTIMNCYLVPVPLLTSFIEQRSTFGTAKFSFSIETTTTPITSEATFAIGSILNLSSGTNYITTSVSATKTYQVTPNKNQLTYVGSLNNLTMLPYINKSYDVTIRYCIANAFSVVMCVNGKTIDLTNDFSTNFVYNEYTQYIAQNSNSINQSQQTKLIGSLVAILGSVGAIATGNISAGVIGTIGSGINIYSAITSQKAKEKDLEQRPQQVANNINSIMNLIMFNGVDVYRFTPENANDVQAYNEYYGFGFSDFIETLNLAPEQNDRFKYYKLDSIQVIGEFNFDVKKYLEYLFKRGLRIWYNRKHYLDSMSQKLTQEEIEE